MPAAQPTSYCSDTLTAQGDSKSPNVLNPEGLERFVRLSFIVRKPSRNVTDALVARFRAMHPDFKSRSGDDGGKSGKNNQLVLPSRRNRFHLLLVTPDNSGFNRDISAGEGKQRHVIGPNFKDKSSVDGRICARRI